MKLLLTSAGIKNSSVQKSQVDLLGQADCRLHVLGLIADQLWVR